MPSASGPTGHAYLTIGQLARRTQCAVSAIRYYEEVGLIPPATRSDGGHRLYAPALVNTLTLARRCRQLGFSLDETKALVQLSSQSDQDCSQVRQLAQTHLASVQAKLRELRQLQLSLMRTIQHCEAQCPDGPANACCMWADIGQDATP